MINKVKFTSNKKLNQRIHNLSTREDAPRKTKYWKIFWGTTIFSIVLFFILLVLFVNHAIDTVIPNLIIAFCYGGLYLYWMLREKAIVMEDDLVRLTTRGFAISFMLLCLMSMLAGEKGKRTSINTDFIEGYMQGVAVGSVIS